MCCEEVSYFLDVLLVEEMADVLSLLLLQTENCLHSLGLNL